MDALNASFDLLKSQLFQCPHHSMQEQLITVYVKRGGGGQKGYNLKFLKQIYQNICS